MKGLVHVSQRNPWFGKLSMAEKGKAVAIETEEEEEDLQALITQIEAQDDEAENVSQVPSAINIPPYIPPWKGKAKISKDLEATKSALQTPLHPDEIRFEGLPLGRVPTVKFEDWDLIDSKKFIQLATEKLIEHKWLRSVEKAGLLHLQSIPHYHLAPITIFVIKKLLCLVHDGCL